MTVRANDRYTHAIRVTTDLLSRLKLTFAFVGNVARSAWLGTSVQSGSIDVLALMSPEQKNNVAMMASNRGFRVDRAEIEQSEELDLIPLNVEEIRVHVLVASNALYARMVTGAVDAVHGVPLRVVSKEDLALLMSLAEDPTAELLVRLPDFDRRAYNERLISIGLSQLVVAE